MSKLRLAILISGRGSNMRALIKAAAAPDYPADIQLVLSNRADAAGLDYAAATGLATACIDHKPFGKNRQSFEKALQARLIEADIQLIALAGFMRILTPWFVDQWAGRLINIHPSLLPKYKGLNTHVRALQAGEREHGCSVHWVSAGVDEGEVIDQAKVPVWEDDTPETLQARVLSEEHRLYPAALKKACQHILQRSSKTCNERE